MTKEERMKAQNKSVSVFYGTARVNLEGFKPLQNSFRNTNEQIIAVKYDVTSPDAIVFARMTTSPGDGIAYEETDSSKTIDVPILVSINNIKIDKPLQISGYHMGRSDSYTGSPTYVNLSSDSAHRLLKDAIKVNPHLRTKLEELYTTI
jgi:hypothetical protein